MNETTRSVLTIHVGKLKDQLEKQKMNEEAQAGHLRRTRLTIESLSAQIKDLTETLEEQ